MSVTALTSSLLHYGVYVGRGPEIDGLAQFFHTASGLPVTAVDFLLLFLAFLGIQRVQVGYPLFLLRQLLRVRPLVVDLSSFFREQPLLSVAVRKLRGAEVV